MSKVTNVIKTFFTKNLGLKGLSILLAIITFYVIRAATSFEVSYDIPIEIELKPGIAILEKETETIHVTFRGAPEDLSKLDQQLLKVALRPHSGELSGPQRIPITPRSIHGAQGVTIESIKPSSVMITFDHEVQKSVLIEKPIIQGVPLIGRAELEYSPKVAMISGSHQRLSDLKSVTTEPVDVDGRVKSFNKTIGILIPGGKGNIKVEPKDVLVKVNIITEVISVTKTNVPVLAITEPGTYSTTQFEPSTVTVTLEGSAEVMDHLDFGKIRVFANCLKLNTDSTNAIPLNVHLPMNRNISATIEPDHVMLIRNNDDIL